MSRFESEMWYLLFGILFGMVIQFWFWFDLDFYRTLWPAIAFLLCGWFIIRDIIMGRRKHDQSGMGQHSH